MNTAVATPSWKSIGLYLQIAGSAAFVAGVVLSLEHYLVGICFVGGAAAFFAGKKMKSA
jgi:hypothetical protein